MKNTRQIFSEIFDFIHHPDKDILLASIDKYLNAQIGAGMIEALSDTDKTSLSQIKEEKAISDFVVSKSTPEKVAEIYSQVSKNIFEKYFELLAPTLSEDQLLYIKEKILVG